MNEYNADDFSIVNQITPDDIIQGFTDIENNESIGENENLSLLIQLFSSILEIATRDERIQFPTLFSRLAYVGIQNELPKTFLFYAHSFRRCHKENVPTEVKIALGKYVISHLLNVLWGNLYSGQSFSLTNEIKQYFFRKHVDFKVFIPYTEALLIKIDKTNFTFRFIDENESETEKIAHWNVADKNEIFNQNLISIDKYFSLPIPINLIESEVTQDNEFYPRGIVLQPDFLVDATAIAECFKENGSFPLLYLINKFRDAKQKTPILIGNIINYLLEEIFLDPTKTLSELQEKIFKKFGFNLASLSDNEMREVWQKVSHHFFHLKRTVQDDFPQLGIRKEISFLEPSFYSRKYGIQGRLDLFVQDENSGTYSIVELKSGSPWRPNAYGISASHFSQTQIYEMLVRSVFDKRIQHVKNYILYSKEANNTLRFSPTVKTQHWEILKVRNDIIIIEELLKSLPENPKLLQIINVTDLPFATGFIADTVQAFEKNYKNLSPFEKMYIHYLLSFISREYASSKVGEHGTENAQGHAALWLESEEEKFARFALLSGLKIINNQSNTENPTVTFSLQGKKQISNFRKGDIAVIYPQTSKSEAVLSTHLYKCTVIRISGDLIEVKLRNKQNNQTYFTSDYDWNIEEDLIDSSFHKLNESVHEFINSGKEYRSMYLGEVPPAKSDFVYKMIPNPSLTSEQVDIVKRSIESKDFFLIWGPPGTGKTNVVLKNIVRELFLNTDQNIMLLAYTNRAVDEICMALGTIDPDFNRYYMRIGSRNSTHPDFHANLIENQIENCTTRQQLRQLIADKRIYISTVSSILGKPEIFTFKQFDTVIIDEASQILEPFLCGLLNRFAKRILIGDHKQLPAVVAQDHTFTKVTDETLINNGFKDVSYSLFDRMIQQYQNKGWHHAIGILTYQGRMHVDLQSFVDRHFYENLLKPLPVLPRLVHQDFFNSLDESDQIFSNRKIFIHTPSRLTSGAKVNALESETCVSVINRLVQIFHKEKMSIHPSSIGIITPFRAQITRIREDLQSAMPEFVDKITIDTVERYQGGARDIIIISTCVKNQGQLKRITSVNQHGIDRKLNVSLTRAKEQIIMIGNKDVLRENPLYASWISESHVCDFTDFISNQSQEITEENNTPAELT